MIGDHGAAGADVASPRACAQHKNVQRSPRGAPPRTAFQQPGCSGRTTAVRPNDPELTEILRRFIFGDVFDTGVVDDQTRELITVTVLACLQTLPQLNSHAAAA